MATICVYRDCSVELVKTEIRTMVHQACRRNTGTAWKFPGGRDPGTRTGRGQHPGQQTAQTGLGPWRGRRLLAAQSCEYDTVPPRDIHKPGSAMSYTRILHRLS